MDSIRTYLPFLIPILVIELGLIIAALIDLFRRERTRGPKWVWLLIILFISLFGPILYFILGRADEE